MTTAPNKQLQPPVRRVARKTIGQTNVTILFVRAGGQCEFHGCAKNVCEHSVTKTPGLYGQKAHIVSFADRGPRSHDGPLPSDIDTLDNLMLLCPDCHKLVDVHPDDYPRATLETYKRQHEDRIRTATKVGPDTRTHVVVFKAPIRGTKVDVARADVIVAIKPRHQWSSQWDVVDLNDLAGQRENAAFLELAEAKINQRIAHLFDPDGPLVDRL